MCYIHNSKLGSHGRLKSTNCLVDNRWMLRITDYGIAKFIETSTNLDTQDEHEKCKGMFVYK